jgi:hypothetical protein
MMALAAVAGPTPALAQRVVRPDDADAPTPAAQIAPTPCDQARKNLDGYLRQVVEQCHSMQSNGLLCNPQSGIDRLCYFAATQNPNFSPTAWEGQRCARDYAQRYADVGAFCQAPNPPTNAAEPSGPPCLPAGALQLDAASLLQAISGATSQCENVERRRLTIEAQRTAALDPEGYCQPLTTRLASDFQSALDTWNRRDRGVGGFILRALENQKMEYAVRTLHVAWDDRGNLGPSERAATEAQIPAFLADLAPFWRGEGSGGRGARDGAQLQQEDAFTRSDLATVYQDIASAEQQLPACHDEGAKKAAEAQRQALDEEGRAKAAKEREEAAVAKRMANPKFMRPILSAKLCWYKSTRSNARREAATDLRYAGEVGGLVDKERLYNFQIIVRNADAAIETGMAEFRQRRMTPMSCDNALVHELAKCVSNVNVEGYNGAGAGPVDPEPACKSDKLQDYLELEPGNW